MLGDIPVSEAGLINLGLDELTIAGFSQPAQTGSQFYFIPSLEQKSLSADQPSTLDIRSVRADFPALNQKVHGKQLVWLDNAATTHKPQSVIDALIHFYAHDNSNIH